MCAIKWGGSVCWSCWPHARGPVPRRCSRPRAPSARWGTCGAPVRHGFTRVGPTVDSYGPPTWIQSTIHKPLYHSVRQLPVQTQSALGSHEKWQLLDDTEQRLSNGQFCRATRCPVSSLLRPSSKKFNSSVPPAGCCTCKCRVACLLIVCLSVFFSYTGLRNWIHVWIVYPTNRYCATQPNSVANDIIQYYFPHLVQCRRER